MYMITLSAGLWLLSGCNRPEPEVKATILLYDATRSRCGGSWQLQLQGEQEVRRVLGYDSIPVQFRVANTNIWLKFKPDEEQTALGFSQCNFIKAVSLRER